MEVKEQIIRELHGVPRSHYREILDYIRSKKDPAGGIDTGTAPASGSSEERLAEPGEDEAWMDLKRAMLLSSWFLVLIYVMRRIIQYTAGHLNDKTTETITARVCEILCS